MMMHVDMVYHYPIWAVGFVVVGLAVTGAVVLELVARRVIRFETRRQSHDVAAAMFSVIGVTFAVLLAFVVMLTFEGSKAAISAATEAMVAQDVASAADGMADPTRAAVRRELTFYLAAVIEREWPAQARGRENDSASPHLYRLDVIAASSELGGPVQATYPAAPIAAKGRLSDARAIRQLAARSNVPSIVWVVMLVGGALTVASGSFLAAPSTRLHLAMSATLAASGALVVVLVIVLSQPFRGDIRVSAAPLAHVLAFLKGETDRHRGSASGSSLTGTWAKASFRHHLFG